MSAHNAQDLADLRSACGGLRYDFRMIEKSRLDAIPIVVEKHLDTHIALELCAGDLRKIGRQARRTIESDGDPRISPMVLVEFEYMRLAQRVNMPAEAIAAALSADLGVRVCETSFAGVGRQELAEGWTTDPFDRLIVAQARWQKAKLITRDTKIQNQYQLAFC